jgi:hypothetical protein
MSDDPYKAPELDTETGEQSEFVTSGRLPATRMPSLWIGIGFLGFWDWSQLVLHRAMDCQST